MIIQPALKSLTSKGENSALPNMTFTVLSGITHWNLVALHKTIDYLFPTPALVDRPGSEVVGSSCEGERRLPCPLRRDQSRRVPCLLPRHQGRQKTAPL